MSALSRWGRIALRLAAASLIVAPVMNLTAQDPPTDSSALVNNVFSPAPRELRQLVTRAQEAVQEEQYSDAVRALREIFDSAGSDDYFLLATGKSEPLGSLKSEALGILGSMPLKGRQLYELECGHDAKAALEAALSAGDLQQLVEVSRRYFHTKAGYEATLLLGRYQLDQGRPLAAALTLKRIADSPLAAGQYDPELSVMLATCWVHARMPDKATETLAALKRRLPQAKVRLIDKEATLFDKTEDALAWLEEIVGGGRTPLSLAAHQWAMFRGNETRNALTDGGVPLLNYRWYFPTINDPQDEAKVKGLARSTRDRGDADISSLQPIVVQDCVIVRSPDSSKLVGVDLRTGKRQWVFPPFDDSRPRQVTTANPLGGKVSPGSVRDQELQQRVWEDHAFGQVSSDGRQVYVLDELGYAGTGSPRVQILAGGIQRPGNGTSTHNMLVALDLKKQGYQMWAVGGTTGDNPALNGAFFFGAPLPMGDQLLAIAELNGEIRLVCLNSASGALEWKQQLAAVEDNQRIIGDRTRRLAGASPSYADGVVVCPTAAGAVVAVDLTTRSLRWGYQYPRYDAPTRTLNGITVSSRTVQPNPGHWIDGTATIADGCVILTPIESQELHCLDLLSGKAKWPKQPRDEMLFVACVHAGKAVLVGKNKVKAVQLADGKPGWSQTIDLGTDSPTGRGYYTDRYYYLPVSGQQLLKIDVVEGKVITRAKTENDLGNVICYEDQLISQSPHQVAAFFLSEPLVARIEELLKKNPDDAEALTLKGQVLLQSGLRTESLAMLRRAVEKNPDSAEAKSLLVKVMLALVREDFNTHFALTEELNALVTDPTQRREILRFRALGLAKAGKTWEALQALLALADDLPPRTAAASTATDLLESIDRDLLARPERWLQGQLSRLARSADEPTRQRLAVEVDARLQKATAASPAALRQFLELYGFHALAVKGRLALAEKLVAADSLLEAELLVGDLIEASDKNVAGQAWATLASLYEKAQRPELAAYYYEQLGKRFSDVPCREGLTGAQLAQRAQEIPALKPLLAASQWPAGRTEVTLADASASSSGRTLQSQRMQFPVQLLQYQGAALRGLRASFDLNGQQIVVRDDLGRQLAMGSLKPADGTSRRYFSFPYNMLTGKVNGHLVVVSLGGEVLALDALRGERAGSDAVTWRQDSIEPDPSGRSLYASQKQSNNPLMGNRLVSYDPSGRLNFSTGPVQSQGVCFQKGRRLLCVDAVTGQSIWERAQVPAGAEIFGDDELIFAADPTGTDALVLSAIDGSLLGNRTVGKVENRWTTHGRRMLTWSQTGSTITVRLTDAWLQGPDLWSKPVPLGSRGTLIEGEELAILEPSGLLTVVSLATGDVRFASPLVGERLSSLAAIQVLRSREQYILLVSQENAEAIPGVVVQPVATAGAQQTRVHGPVYAFDRRTGKAQWQVPAFVAQHYLPQEQPSETPLLFFVRNMQQTGGGGAARSYASVLCLDKRDGRIVWENEVAKDANGRPVSLGQTSFCDLVADPLRKTVTMSLYMPPAAKTLTFRLTDQPTPPQPPAQTGQKSSLSVGEVAGSVDRSVGDAFDILNRGGNLRDLLPDLPVRVR